MFNLVKHLVIFLTLFCSITLFGNEKEWTVVVYLSSDNNLSEYMSVMLERIRRVEKSNKINVIVMYDGKNHNDSLLLHFNGDKEIVLESDVEYDMGDTLTLSRLISISKKYPAKKMALLLYSHGRGILNVDTDAGVDNGPFKKDKSILKAFSPDDSQGTYFIEREMTEDLKKSLNGKKIDLLVYNSCLMGNLEVMQTISEIANYAIASEYKIVLNPNNVPNEKIAIGVSFSDIVKEISHSPSINPIDLGKEIIKNYEESYSKFELFMDIRNPEERFASSLSLYDLSKGSEVTKRVGQFLEDFKTMIDDVLTLRKIYQEALTTVKINPMNYIDIGAFLNTIYRATGDERANELFNFFKNQYVVDKTILNVSNDSDLIGVSIFFPMAQIVPNHIIEGPDFDFYENREVVQFMNLASAIKKYTRRVNENFHIILSEMAKDYLENNIVVRFNLQNNENENIVHMFQLLKISLFANIVEENYNLLKEYLQLVLKHSKNESIAKYTADSVKFIEANLSKLDHNSKEHLQRLINEINQQQVHTL